MFRLIILFVFLSFNSYCQSWKSLQGGVNSTVNSMLIDPSNNLIIGGSFTEVNGFPQMGLAVWDSTSFTPFGNNASFSNNFGTVLCMTYFNGDLVIGGHFDSINNIAVNNISRWDGTNWQALGSGFDQDVQTISVYNNTLYAGGTFFNSGTNSVRYFAKWNGNNWVNAAPQIDGYVLSSLVYDGKLIIGGSFNRIDGITFGGIASWNNTDWLNVGSGFNNEVFKLQISEDTLYACGTFTQIPQAPYSYLAKFDGADWIQVPYPIGTTQWTIDIVKFQESFFVCGNFDNPDDLGIINGNVYDSIGSTNGFILDMINYKDQLYAAGNFSTIGNTNAFCIARLDSFLLNGIHLSELFRNLAYVYPNPITQSSSLNLSNDIASDNSFLNIEIYSCVGIMIKQYTLQEFPLQVNVLSPSSYIIKFNFLNGKSFSKKFIVVP